MNKRIKLNTLLSIIGITLSLCVLAISILMTNKLSEMVKTTKEDLNTLTSKYNKMYMDIYGTPEYDVSMFKEIKPNEIKDLSKNKKVAIMITRSTCGYCALFAPILAQIQNDYDIEIKYIDILKVIDYNTGEILDEDANNILLNLDTNTKGSEIMKSYGSTPLFLIIKDNKVINGQVGYSEYSTVETLIKEEGYKKR